MTPSTLAGGTESAQHARKRVTYTHDAMIDLIITNPGISQNAIAAHFGYQRPSISRIFNSDAFQVRLAHRKAELIDPSITETFESNVQALANQSLDIIADKLATTQSADMAFRAFELSTKALGYGARQQAQVTVQNSFVVALPQKAESAKAWAQQHAPGGGLPMVEEVPKGSSTPVPSPDLEALLERV